MSWKVWLEGDCPVCSGTGKLGEANPYCNVCGVSLELYFLTSWMEGDASVLPCGHELDELNEDDRCPECEANGKIARQFTMPELAELLSPYNEYRQSPDLKDWNPRELER